MTYNRTLPPLLVELKANLALAKANGLRADATERLLTLVEAQREALAHAMERWTDVERTTLGPAYDRARRLWIGDRHRADTRISRADQAAADCPDHASGE